VTRPPLQFSKTLWLALDPYFQPQPPDALAKPQDHQNRDRGDSLVLMIG